MTAMIIIRTHTPETVRNINRPMTREKPSPSFPTAGASPNRECPSFARDPRRSRCRRNRALAVGMTVTETISERVTAAQMASEISRKSFPASSSIVRTGPKTAIVVSVEERTAPQTSFVPRSAATLGDSPMPRCRSMFSSTTIALSTTIPTAKLSPAREITFRFRPVSHIATNVPITEIGMATATINVGRGLRRKSSSMTTASEPPSIKLSETSPTAL